MAQRSHLFKEKSVQVQLQTVDRSAVANKYVVREVKRKYDVFYILARSHEPIQICEEYVVRLFTCWRALVAHALSSSDSPLTAERRPGLRRRGPSGGGRRWAAASSAWGAASASRAGRRAVAACTPATPPPQPTGNRSSGMGGGAESATDDILVLVAESSSGAYTEEWAEDFVVGRELPQVRHAVRLTCTKILVYVQHLADLQWYGETVMYRAQNNYC